MGDPLSVAASVAGLLSLAGQISSALGTYIFNIRDVPSFAQSIRSEVDSFRSSLDALNVLLWSPGVQPRRAALIPADFVVLSCTDATLLFSEIEAAVLPLIQHTDFNIVNRVQWTRKRAKLETLVSRLQWQKLTLVMQLNILIWYSFSPHNAAAHTNS